MRRYLGGHLGAHTAALVDQQMAGREQERAWAHVVACSSCQQQVEREAWVKRRVAGLGEPVDAPRWLGDRPPAGGASRAGVVAPAWVAPAETRRRGRGRLLAAGAGTASMALAGMVVWGATAGAGSEPVQVRVPREASFGGGVSRVADTAFLTPSPSPTATGSPAPLPAPAASRLLRTLPGSP